MRGSWWKSGCWFLGAWLVGADAHAQSAVSRDPAPVGLVSTRGLGADECPSTSELRAAVEALLERPLGPESSPSRFEVHFGNESSGLGGTYVLRDAAGRMGAFRSLAAGDGTCVSLARTLAVAIAVAIDPAAALREPSPAPPAAAPTSAEGGADPQARRRGLRWRAVASVATTPGRTLGVGFETGVGLSLRVLPRLRLGVAGRFFIPGVRTMQGLESVIQQSLGVIEACGVALVRERLDLDLCGSVAAGADAVDGIGSGNVSRSLYPVVSAQATAVLRLTPVLHLALDVFAGLDVPILSREYLGPSGPVVVFRSWPASPRMGISLGTDLP